MDIDSRYAKLTLAEYEVLAELNTADQTGDLSTANQLRHKLLRVQGERRVAYQDRDIADRGFKPFD